MSEVFCIVTSRKIAEFVRTVRRRVALCVPAMKVEVANALAEAAGKVGHDAVRVVMDCDEEVFRLGYGEIEAMRKLNAAKIDVRQGPGLRAGLLVVDDQAWAFTASARGQPGNRCCSAGPSDGPTHKHAITACLPPSRSPSVHPAAY
jgi:hypothetical protein